MLTLRPLREVDITERYLSWFRDKDVTKYLDAKNLTRQDVIDYLKKDEHVIYAICYDGLHIGNIKVGPINREHGLSDLPVVIGEKDYWGKGLGTEIIKMGKELAFKRHGIRKLSGGMPATHIGSLKAHMRAGWFIEGYLKDHYLVDGVLVDRICVSCFADKRGEG